MIRNAIYPEPVVDLHGHVVRLVLVAPAEQTCLVCGETSGGNYCERCGADGADKRVPMVATVSYLRPEEYRIEQ